MVKVMYKLFLQNCVEPHFGRFFERNLVTRQLTLSKTTYVTNKPLKLLPRLLRVSVHGCQMVYLHTRDPNFGIFLRPWK
jgi:hypothetical protein